MLQQWLVMMRQWHLIDANMQDVDQLGKLVADHLLGKHKPIYHQESTSLTHIYLLKFVCDYHYVISLADCGDNVIVYNCKRVAMKGFDWKHRDYYFNNRYPKGAGLIPAWKIHEHDPCRVSLLTF